MRKLRLRYITVLCPNLQSEEVAEQDVNSDLSDSCLSPWLNYAIHPTLSSWPACWKRWKAGGLPAGSGGKREPSQLG